MFVLSANNCFATDLCHLECVYAEVCRLTMTSESHLKLIPFTTQPSLKLGLAYNDFHTLHRLKILRC